MKKRLMLIMLNLIICYSAFGLDLDPTTFTADNLKKINSGTTVYLKAGNYLLNQNLANAWALVNRNNVVFKRKSSRTVHMDGSNSNAIVLLNFNGFNGLKLENIKFTNIKLEFRDCTDIILDGLEVGGQKSADDKDHKNNAIEFVRGKNLLVQNCTVRWTYTGVNGKGVKFWLAQNITVKNCIIEGRLRGAVDALADRNQPPMNIKIIGGTYRRQISSGIEDHGIYLHDLSGAVVDGVTISGFTPDSSGGSIKIKNAHDMEVKNCDFSDSGVLLRIEAKTWIHLYNIWIHDNEITASGETPISMWTPDYNPKAIVIENNCFPLGALKITSNPTEVNKYNSLAKKNGGVYNNAIAKEMNLKSGINQSGNFITDGCPRLSILNNELDHEIKIFPNPVNNNLTLKGIEGEANIFDLYGRKVLGDLIINNSSTINVSMLSSGMYLIVFDNKNKKAVKFLKQ